MESPTRNEVRDIIKQLVRGEIDREAASLWAGERHVVETTDPVIEDALDALTLIDARHVTDAGKPLGYMYDFAELRDLLTTLDAPTQQSLEDRADLPERFDDGQS